MNSKYPYIHIFCQMHGSGVGKVQYLFCLWPMNGNIISNHSVLYLNYINARFHVARLELTER